MTHTQQLVYKQLIRKKRIRNTLCAIVALCSLVCILCIISPMWSIGKSMLPTISKVEFLASIPRVLPHNTELQNGDIVVVYSKAVHKRLIKRLIAQPGDTLEIRSNHIYVNGIALDEPYLYEDMVTRDIAPITLGEDMYFVLGDNRNISADSRYYGFFEEAEIIATVELENQSWQRIVAIALMSTLILSITSLLNPPSRDSLLSTAKSVGSKAEEGQEPSCEQHTPKN